MAHQPAYLPWPGYFAKLLGVDRLVVLDHVQFCERGWQNRNRVLGHRGGCQLLTVPVQRRFGQPISAARIDLAQPWAHRHWRTLTQLYGHAPGWQFLAQELEAIYAQPWERLVEPGSCDHAAHAQPARPAGPSRLLQRPRRHPP